MKLNPGLFFLAACPLCVQVCHAEAAFTHALNAVQAAQSDDLGPVVCAVLDSTGGDELAYYRQMRKAADAGHPVALTWTAGQLIRQQQLQGAIAENSPEIARSRAMLEQAVASGYVPAMVELAHLCGSGIGSKADETEGMKYLMQACKAGSQRARAAYLLLSGRLEKEGATGAAVAAELKKNNFHVEEFLAGLNAAADEKQGLEWMQRAASHGSPRAAYRLGMYYMQQGEEERGLELLKQATERNSAEALAYLASLTLPESELSPALQGIIKQDTAAAIRLFQQAVLLGYTPALIPLAGEYRKQPVIYTPERIFELYRLAADAGDPRGGVAYAHCLVTGKGCQAEVERGLRILNQLTDAGISFANMALADLYFNGTGVEADIRKALSALSAASSAGVPQCYTLMAVIAQLGNASKASDPVRASVYLRMAEERGEIAPRQTFDSMVQAGSWKFMP